MEVHVIGPGAIGTLLGGLLAAAGHSVTLRGRTAPAQQSRRLRVVLPGGWREGVAVRRVGPGATPGRPDVTLVTLGRHHLHAIKRPDFLRMLPAGDGPVAFFNADPADTARLAVPPVRARGAVTLLAAVLLQDGDVELAPGRSLVAHEADPALTACLACLSLEGIEVAEVADAGPLERSLLVAQLLWLPAAMCNLTVGAFLSGRAGREIAAAVLAEGIQAMDRGGASLGTLPSGDPRELLDRLRRRGSSFDGGAETPSRAYSPVLQAILRGRPTEAAQVTRRIVDIAGSAGLHLSWNWRLLQKAGRAAGVGFYRGPSELAAALG